MAWEQMVRSGCILCINVKVEPTEFADGLGVGYEQEKLRMLLEYSP